MAATIDRQAVAPSSAPQRPILRAFISAPSAVVALAGIALIVVVAIAGPLLFSEQADRLDTAAAYQAPSGEHLLGTDAVGRDILARLIVGARLSVLLGLGATTIALVLGTTLGLSAALAGPRLRAFLLRVIDTLLSFPGILTAIFVSVVLGVGATGAMIGVGIAGSFTFARITSTLALSTAGRDYISAARVVGVSRHRLWFRYVLANIAEPLLIAGSVAASHAIVTVSGLSFLGLGVRPPSFDWGQMLTEGLKAIYQAPVAALAPAGAIAITALAFGFAGEALARAFNPLLWTRSTDTRDRRAVAGGSLVRHEEPFEAAPGSLLRVENLVVTFPGDDGPVEVVKGVSFSVSPGEAVGIVGESGSGKTMTAMAVAQLIPYPGTIEGVVAVRGVRLAELKPAALTKLLAREVAVVFQNPMSALNPALRVGGQMTMAVQIHRKLKAKAARAMAVQRLEEVNIPAAGRQLRRYPHELSGGIRQRVTIATGIMSELSLLIADEPTTALDLTVQAQIMHLLGEINERRQTAILLISHNLALVSQRCDRVLVMYSGRIVEDLDAVQLRSDPRHPYTRALLGAVPEIGHRRDLLQTIPGEVPDIGDPPTGCAFHPRCPLAIERCRVERPLLVANPGERGRRVACHVANESADA
jgi:oligopeptide/dipeptide ABC transporter ATP-binding protein